MAEPEFALSFGVEFEFCLLTIGKDDVDPDPNDPRSARGIDEVERQQGSNPCASRSRDWFAAFEDGLERLDAAQAHLAQTMRRAGLPTLTDEEIQDRHIKQDVQHRHWVVSSDPSITRSDQLPETYNMHPIEIKSPAFLFDENTIQAIKEFCNLMTSTYRIDCAPTCGLHVHVGSGSPSRTFAPNAIKNFMGLCWVFEKQLRSIHAAHRITDSPWCLNMSVATQLARAPLTELEKLHAIFNSLTLPDLKFLFNTSHSSSKHSAVNLNHLATRAGFGTVELRQHQASLEPNDVAAWVSVCVGLMVFAHTVAPSELHAWLSRYVGPGAKAPLSLREVLRCCGLKEQAAYYQAVM
ncbi:hypothetical protein BP5796_01682 [Coleophoma crateriformis]|uniref:Amidoligase enzyme-domain-containing protein n=1 Tax=Coleophoma crateriformis TaxID=565419 RepID=A0A3D8T2R2_9HELO|nr:hypothetical protein BP5796_01682 [Coleophoma crateriformis]